MLKKWMSISLWVSSILTSEVEPEPGLDKIRCALTSYYCYSGQTCCPLDKEKTIYGCCDYSEGVCCDDFENCCPKGTTCNVSAGTCETNKLSLLFLQEGIEPKKKTMAHLITDKE